MPEQQLPEIIDIRLLGTCDLRCPYCFGPRHELSALPADVLLPLLERLASHGVRTIVITGGEPLLVRDLGTILRRAKALKLRTVLSTNGTLLRERVDEILPWLDWIGLPLDADNADTNRLMRVGRDDHFNITLDNLALLKRNYPQVGIKLGTVAAALNKDHIVGIPTILPRASLPDTWKLYQVAYHSYGADNQPLLELSDAEFNVIADAAGSVAARLGIPFIRAPRRNGNQKHLFVTPLAEAVVVLDDEYVPIGSFVSSFESVIAAWRRHLEEADIQRNFYSTYPASLRRSG